MSSSPIAKTCKKSGRSPLCMNCSRKLRCLFTSKRVSKAVEKLTRSSAKKNKRVRSPMVSSRDVQRKPIAAIDEKNKKHKGWIKFTNECIDESEKQRHVKEGWWKDFSSKNKETAYGTRVQLLKKLGCNLLQAWTSFHKSYISGELL